MFDIINVNDCFQNDIKEEQLDPSKSEETTISEYEQKILDNIAEKQKILASLGIIQDVKVMKEEEEVISKSKVLAKKKPK